MAIFQVANAAALQSALAQAVGGDRIVLAAGDYGSVVISNRRYSAPVTLVSAGAAGSAHFDGLNVRNSNNLTFQSLDIGRELNHGEGIYTNLNSIRNSSNIRMLGVSLHGSKDGNPANDGQGLVVSDVTNFRLENSEISDLTRGVYVERSTNVTFSKNDFHHIRMDGLAIASTNTLYTLGNMFRNFQPQATDHADAIQIWNTNQSKGSSNILIRDNVIWMPEEQPDGTAGVQGIWIADPGAHGYQNVWIRNNLVYSNDIWNGISVIGGRNVDVSGNTMLSRPDDNERLWVRIEDSVQASITNNVTEDMILRGVNPALRNNYNLQQSPGLRNLFADLYTPDAVSDLLLPGVGYQVPGGIKPSAKTGTSALDDLAAMPVLAEASEMLSIDLVSTGAKAQTIAEVAADIDIAPAIVAPSAPAYALPTSDWFIAMA